MRWRANSSAFCASADPSAERLPASAEPMPTAGDSGVLPREGGCVVLDDQASAAWQTIR